MASSGQVSFAFLMKSWHLMPENTWKWVWITQRKILPLLKPTTETSEQLPGTTSHLSLQTLFRPWQCLHCFPNSCWFQWEFWMYPGQEVLPTFPTVIKPLPRPVMVYLLIPRSIICWWFIYWSPKSHSPGHKSWAKHGCSECYNSISDYPSI